MFEILIAFAVKLTVVPTDLFEAKLDTTGEVVSSTKDVRPSNWVVDADTEIIASPFFNVPIETLDVSATSRSDPRDDQNPSVLCVLPTIFRSAVPLAS